MEEKSRRKGRFNIVDIIVVLILIAGLAFVGFKFLGDGSGSATASTRIEYTVLVPGVRAEVCENIMDIQREKGQVQLMANGQLLDGYVTAVEAQPHVSYEPNDMGVIMISQEVGEGARVDMLFTIQAAVDNTVTCKVGTQEVRIGKTHIVKTTEFELEGYDDVVVVSREVIG